MELHDGDIIVFKDIINTDYITLEIDNNLIFKISTNDIIYNGIFIRILSNKVDLIYAHTGSTGSIAYSGSWISNSYKTITIVGDQTITDEMFINWLYENTVSGLPPRVMENMYSVVGDQIQYSFSNIGDVVGSIVNNGVLTIFTLGIFIVSLAVGLLRRISRRKNFK